MVTPQQRYEFLQYAQSLFAQARWEADQWEAFADAFTYHPFDVAKQAVKQHFQETRYITPTTGAVVNLCKVLRFGSADKRPSRAIDRTADMVVAEFRWAWEKATAMYGTETAVRLFASRDGSRAANELRRLGWSPDQIDVVIQEITNGMVTDAFRSCLENLRATWSARVGHLAAGRVRFHAPAQGGGGVSQGVREGVAGTVPDELPGDREVPQPAEPLDGVLPRPGPSVESQGDFEF